MTTPRTATSVRPTGAGLPVRVIRDDAGLADVRAAWSAMQGDQISSDPDYFEAGLRSDPLIVRPQVYVLERDGEPAAMLIGRIESLDLGVRLGYRKLYAPHVSSITIVYGGILGDVDEGSFRALLGAVRGSLAAGDADVAIFRYLDIDSPLYRIASSVPGLLARGHAQPRETHWEVELRPSFEEFVASLPADGQKAMSARFKRLTRDFRDRLEVRRTTEPADVDAFFHDVGAVAVKTYQHALGVAFEDTPAHRERARICAEHGWFRGYVLRLDGQPVAFEHGELYRGRYRGSPGYDLAFAQYRPGAYLATRVFADLCEDEDARIFDYGVGDADYKQALGTHSRQESNVVVYAPTFRSARINLTRTALQAGVAATKRVLDHGDLAQTVKKRWRDRLSKPR